MNPLQDQIIGSGWEFPPVFDKDEQGVRLLTGLREIENSIYIILHTTLGERIMRRSFGSNLHQLQFEPLTENLKTYMASSLRESLETNEPRIEIQSLRLNQPDPSLGRIDIEVEVMVRKTLTPLSLILPYYLSDQA